MEISKVIHKNGGWENNYVLMEKVVADKVVKLKEAKVGYVVEVDLGGVLERFFSESEKKDAEYFFKIIDTDIIAMIYQIMDYREKVSKTNLKMNDELQKRMFERKM